MYLQSANNSVVTYKIYYANCKQIQAFRSFDSYRDISRQNLIDFKYISVVARVISLVPNMMISDETSHFKYCNNFKPIDTSKLSINHYYQFFFQSKRMNNKAQMEIVNCIEVGGGKIALHWMRIINCEMKRLQKKKKYHQFRQNQDLYFMKQLKEKLQNWILAIKKFSIEDIRLEFPDYSAQQIDRAMNHFQQSGLVTNYGLYYDLT